MSKRSEEKPEQKRTDALSYALFTLLFLVGFCILAYPKVSNYWNSLHASRAILSYTETISSMDNEKYDKLLADARAYNLRILNRANPYTPTGEELAEYYKLLDVSGTGVMGYIEVPLIGATYPIYHGTSESILQTAIGHIEWTGLPVGGSSTHCALSGHRGLPTAELFSKLDKLAVGDRFMLNILNDVLTYEVDQILIVLPEDSTPLSIVPGEDYCTLTTCTPYGINSHRLLVRGHRVDTVYERVVRVTADAIQLEPVIVAGALAIPLILLAIIILLITDRKSWREKMENEER